MEWSVLLLFLGIQLTIGVWAARRVKSEEDYLVAGRRLGVPMVTMSMFATWFGAETCLGSSGAVYERGLAGGRADPFGYAVCLLLVGLLLAVPLHRGRYLTLGDLYREKFGRHAERVLVLVLVPGSILWGAAQLRAFGQVISTTSHLPVMPATVFSALFAIVYTSFGGLWGDVLTDLLQGTILCVGLVTLLFACALDLPTGAALGEVLHPARLSLLPPSEGALAQLDRWAVPIIGSLVTQEMTARVLAARTPEVAKRGAIASSIVYIVFGSIPVVLGLLGPALLPSLPDPEQLLPELARQKLPTALYLLFACALLSAILSTVDSIFLSASTLVSHNWLVPALGLKKEAHKLWLERSLVVVGGLIALYLALGAKSIYELLEASAMMGAAGLVVTVLCDLYTKRPSQVGAIAALLIGAVLAPLLERWNFQAPFLLATAGATASYAVGAWLFGRSAAAPAEAALLTDRE
jgi:SSS family solute:Na+ symporter